MILLESVFPAKQFQGKICLSPFVMMEVTIDGDVRLCGCAGWMPTTVGNLFQQSIKEILSSPLACKIRQTIIDGTYTYCDDKVCGVMLNNQLNDINNIPLKVRDLITDSTKFRLPHEISIAGDLTCNLTCPSCRTAVIKNTEQQIQKNQQLGEILANSLFSMPTDDPIHLIVSTSGEIFASALLLQFVNSIPVQKFPGLTLDIQTNGLLMPTRWDRLGAAQSHVKKLTMTLDAARSETYEIVRRGGAWPDAMAAMNFIKTLKAQGIQISLRMVVQRQNYKEVIEFYNLARQYDVDQVEYLRLSDWRTWSNNEFRLNDVFDHQHPERKQALELMNLVKQLDRVFIVGDFT